MNGKFLWGAATAAYQVEGDSNARGFSVWDVFAEHPGNIADGTTGRDASLHIAHMEEDLDALKGMGLNAYRFSVSWPRILPEGTGRVSGEGAAVYHRLIDGLLKRGITPCMTLFHWDYPYALHRRGGWLNPDAPKWFADYAAVCAKRYGDRVKMFITQNEPQCFVEFGYQTARSAPGERLPDRMIAEVVRSVLLAHGGAVDALRAEVSGARIGYAVATDIWIPEREEPELVAEAQRRTFPEEDERLFSNILWGDAIVKGRYPAGYLRRYGKFLEEYDLAADFERIARPLDFWGVNVYSGTLVGKRNGAFQTVERVAAPRTAMGWTVEPESLYWAAKFMCARYGLPLYVTENGVAEYDYVSADGGVHDPQRADYVREYVAALMRAKHEGADVRGYFYWSLMDNFEWAEGLSKRFGLLYMDYATGRRVKKDSASAYAALIEKYKNE